MLCRCLGSMANLLPALMRRASLPAFSNVEHPRGEMAAEAVATAAGPWRRASPSRHATSATSLEARQTILLELVEWEDISREAPSLVGLRDRLARGQDDNRSIER